MKRAIEDQDFLTVGDLAQRFGITRSTAYRLARLLPSYRIPGVGLRFRTADVREFEERSRRDPVAQTGDTRRRRLVGMPVAEASDDDEVVFEGMTRRELREKAGW